MSVRNPTQPLTILLSALGGEGGGVLAEWLVETAQRLGHAVQATSIPGVAQRTGATTYYVELMATPQADGAARPVFSLYPVPGELDLLVGSELLEAARQCALGLVSERTAVLASTSRSLTTIEKMQQADGRVPAEQLAGLLQAQAGDLQLFDMGEIARQHGTIVSAVMFGALAGWCVAGGGLPWRRQDYEATITGGKSPSALGKTAQASLAGFAAAFDRVMTEKAQRDRLVAVATQVQAELGGVPADAAPSVAMPAGVQALPAALREIAALGHARLVDYQDEAYAALYLQRLAALVQAARAGSGPDPATAGRAPASAASAASTESAVSPASSDSSLRAGLEACREAARWLALWMAFDDIVRVAELKSRASRRARVARETGARSDELLRTWEHFKPGVPEVAGLLPPRLATALERWDARRVARGREPLAWPIRLASHTVGGLLLLRTLAGLRRLRRLGRRYADEQALIERWLAAVARGLAEHAPLGLALARLGRLIKGYGSTHERGRQALLHIVDHLAFAAAVGDAPARAAAVQTALAAAMADDAGRQLDATLTRHGAAPRPVPEQPIRWVGRRPGGVAAGRLGEGFPAAGAPGRSAKSRP